MIEPPRVPLSVAAPTASPSDAMPDDPHPEQSLKHHAERSSGHSPERSTGQYSLTMQRVLLERQSSNRHDREFSGESDSAAGSANRLPVEGPAPVQPPPVEATVLPSGHRVAAKPTLVRVAPRRSDAVTLNLTLLATVGLILLAARFVIPQIVEEVRYAWHRGELRAEYETGVDGLKNVSLEALSDAYQHVSASVGPSVVHIDVSRAGPGLLAGGPEGSRRRGGGTDPIEVPEFLRTADQGSGVLVDADGHILTNRHVILGGGKIVVTLSDGRRRPATVIGSDKQTDLALLKVDADRLIPIVWGDSDRCKVGSPVWAVGSPFGLDRTVTFGIVSGKHRKVLASTDWQDFMQSDVAVNPGNSGGPLVDARGTLVGINTAILGDTYQGISFSVPSNVAKKIYSKLRATGRVDRGWLGVALAPVPDQRVVGDNQRLRGAIVSQLNDPAGPAALAGILAGDIILEVQSVPVRDSQHLVQLIGQATPGQRVTLTVDREGEKLEISVLLGINQALR